MTPVQPQQPLPTPTQTLFLPVLVEIGLHLQDWELTQDDLLTVGLTGELHGQMVGVLQRLREMFPDEPH